MSRKRPAPGTSPAMYPAQPQHVQNSYVQPGQSLTDDQFFDWGENGQGPTSYANQPVYNTSNNQYPAQQMPNMLSNQSNQVARRPVNTVVPRPPLANNQWMPDHQNAQHNQQQPPNQLSQQQQEQATAWSDDINDLLAKAQVAKKESQAKRKQIPPFVLKLHR